LKHFNAEEGLGENREDDMKMEKVRVSEQASKIPILSQLPHRLIISGHFIDK